ncbi:D-serine ammonia-lyase [Neisseria dumasiana]|uniref:D-serine ammonia-lyase n=1 Tax=Neisseria dumasiana TaxID=1931275 RepID=UPI00263B0121|nr:D-serine ammonia-lyase [Neisseria dumasiana]
MQAGHPCLPSRRASGFTIAYNPRFHPIQEHSTMPDLSAFQNDPVMQRIRAAQPVCWHNPHTAPFAEALSDVGLTRSDVDDAAARLRRFAPYIRQAFPETAASDGIIESPLYRAASLQQAAGYSDGLLYIKADNELPVSGSIKARGGIYEVLQHAEQLALAHGLIDTAGHYTQLGSPAARKLFARHTVAVGSTGNLGLSIGIMAAKLGFCAAVHMSADARQWKKDKLRAAGVEVFEYTGDYGQAVAAGRKQAEADPLCYFVDDENSRHLFLGYSVAAGRLKKQFEQAGITINRERPLYVYLPCGVGGGPGGVAFGLKLAFGDNVHCIFAEPVQSPCMLLGVYTGLHERISVQDIGLNNRTAADGLAVGRPSGFVGRAMQRSLNAFYTVEDSELFRWLRLVHETEGLKLEPSACAGFAGLRHFRHPDAVHLVWATGGNMVPEEIFAEYLAQD